MLFFSLCFAALFLTAVLVRYLHIRIDAVRFLPPQPERTLEELLNAVRWALPVTVYFTLLLSLSYSSRRHISVILSIIFLVILASAFSAGISLGTGSLARIPSPPRDPKILGYPGLILTQADNVIVLLRDPTEQGGSRVVSIPDRPLIYQQTPIGPNNTILSLPPAPFRASMAWFLQSLTIDLSLTGRQFALRFSQGIVSFLIYGASLIFLLASLRFILDLSNWPLANLFLGALAYRGILALETFLNMEEVQEFLASFLGSRVPSPFITPLGFCALAFLICLYTGLNWLARRRNDDGD
ncbi:hypothetical protein AGMMS49546_13860 [Spirochaetia bacterium]|nr:hypothetical protein AGMMS49546_13860 [Spirochaetia bacterium]